MLTSSLGEGRRCPGFSLVELLLVMTLLLVVAGLSAHFFRTATLQTELQNAAAVLKADLEVARIKAIASDKRTQIAAIGSTGYVGFVDADGNRVLDAGEEVFVSRDFSESGGGLFISAYSEPFWFKPSGSGIPSRSITIRQNSTGKSAKVSINLGQGTSITYF